MSKKLHTTASLGFHTVYVALILYLIQLMLEIKNASDKITILNSLSTKH